MLRPAYLIGAVAGVAAAAYGFFVWREKQTEKPEYFVVEADGAIELRDYPELLVAEAITSGNRADALNSGFRKLARYIFAQDREGEDIAMTAPVLSERIAMTAPVLSEAEGPGWRTRFVMPAEYSRETLPAPGPGVEIATVPARRVAAIRFPGKPDDAVLRAKEKQLRAWLQAKGRPADGQVSYAFYNSPYIPPPMRRNEVLIELS